MCFVRKKITGGTLGSEHVGRKSSRDSHGSLGLLGRPHGDVYKVPRAKVGPGIAFLFVLSFEKKATDSQC